MKGGSTTLENTYKDEIFTKRVRAGKRTYFFDVKSTKSEKDFYITITESKRVGEEEYEKHKIFLYKEDFEKFSEGFSEVIDFIKTVKASDLVMDNVITEGTETADDYTNVEFDDLESVAFEEKESKN